MKSNEVGSDYSNSQILIIGAGLMGCGISQVFASLGVDVFLYDPLKQALDDAKQKIQDKELEVLQYIKEQKIDTLQSNAIQLVAEGVTSIEEIYPLLLS